MDKAVIFAQNANNCKLIIENKKSLIITKTLPSINIPFKGYLYCNKKLEIDSSEGKVQHYLFTPTNNIYSFTPSYSKLTGVYEDSNYKLLNGKVIGEFICNRIKVIIEPLELERGGQVTAEELNKFGANSSLLYGVEITNFKLYDEPKEVTDFYVYNTIWKHTLSKIANSWTCVEDNNNG
jgi:hypothetical protein